MSQDPVRCDLRAALLTWCFEDRIEDIHNIERYFMSQELATFGYPNLGGASNRTAPTPMAEHSFEGLRVSLDHAWKGILLDFRKRVQRQEMYLVGVQTAPERQLHESPIPGQWAADFRFDVLANTIEFGPYRFVNVGVLPEPPPPPEPDASTTETLREVRPEDVATLDDETVLVLLEAHAERVIRSPDAKLIAPGKISLMPLVRGKMRHRAEVGERLPTLKAEAHALAEWIRSKVQLHQVPTAATIQKVLGPEYAQLKRRSKAAI